MGIIVNRMKGGRIGEHSAKAAASIGDAKARHVLQGRNENTGLMAPDERSIKVGSSVPVLLA